MKPLKTPSNSEKRATSFKKIILNHCKTICQRAILNEQFHYEDAILFKLLGLLPDSEMNAIKNDLKTERFD